MFKNDNDKLSCEKIDFTPFRQKCMILSLIVKSFRKVFIDHNRDRRVVDMILKFALFISSLLFFIFSLFAILACECESSNSPFFLHLQPVGFVTFNTRAGAEAAKQDLQVSLTTRRLQNQNYEILDFHIHIYCYKHLLFLEIDN